MKIYIGDTPEQLGSYQTADAIIVGDKVVTKADYLALVAQVETYKIALDTVSSVVSGKTEFSLSEINSDYLNRILKASPSQCLREIQAEAGLVGYFRGTDDAWQALVGTSSPEQMTAHLATQYAERIRQGGE